MVHFEDIDEPMSAEETPSETRLLDAQCLEGILDQVSRPSARIHLENVISKLKKESSALKRVEASKERMQNEGNDNQMKAENTTTTVEVEQSSAASVDQEAASSEPAQKPAPSASQRFVSIDKFAFDAGSYNSQFLTLYISLVGVGTLEKSNVECGFTKDSFDLIVRGYKGKDYRLFRDNLEKDLNADKCKYIVKADKIVIKLAKVKGEYGYDSWQNLTEKKGKKKKASADTKDPNASIMDLMKDMYDSGDDKMKKMIGETMMKQREGKLGKGVDGMGDMGMDM